MKSMYSIAILAVLSTAAYGQVVKRNGDKVVIKNSVSPSSIGHKVIFKDQDGLNQGYGTIQRVKNNLALVKLEQGMSSNNYRIISSTNNVSAEIENKNSQDKIKFSLNAAFSISNIQEISEGNETLKRKNMKADDEDGYNITDIYDHKSIDILGEIQIPLTQSFSTSSFAGLSISPSDTVVEGDGYKMKKSYLEPKVLQKVSYNIENNGILFSPYVIGGVGLYNKKLEFIGDSTTVDMTLQGINLQGGAGLNVKLNNLVEIFGEYRLSQVSKLKVKSDDTSIEENDLDNAKINYSNLSIGLKYNF
ncbi:outer membrane protein [Bacteriovorax sp. DB6_IX]|uniref:outer membrane protein n=1 Tax=Bacteriovorax sp. DB6_IX TaxID=1353530 RepID=UPI000389EC64|nr:outer membrane beta-barrel protein [Bacteriovorax sp. DB6_IX]EQC51576.1 outer membrane protein beta-barrel domain protein [Bacteriovorax sp. DB6_IX]